MGYSVSYGDERRPTLGRRFVSFLYPDSCVCCGTLLDAGEQICATCAEKLQEIKPPFCPFCCVSDSDCSCRKTPRAYRAAVAPYYDEASAREAILRMKFSSKESVAAFFADAMGKTLDARLFGVKIDIVTCVPMSKERLSQRGFNQSRSLAEMLMRNRGDCFPLRHAKADYGLLVKNAGKASNTQHLLSGAGRAANAFGAYDISDVEKIKNKTILLVDDIITTGATVGECAAILSLAGAKDVYVCCAAMARMKKTDI